MKTPIFEQVSENNFKLKNENSIPTGVDEQNLEEEVILLYEKCQNMFTAAVETENKNAINRTSALLNKMIRIVDATTNQLKNQKVQRPPLNRTFDQGVTGLKTSLRGLGFKK